MPDGKEVLYAYDAAGRLVQEGEKSYEYGWLDKVTRILENGKEVARFEYHNNNQLAKVVRENGVETFEWDGLALIERNGTKYINEPHAGGGNPILAIGGDGQKTEAIFTDILGTSMGKVSGNGYSAIDKTSFGADTSDKSSFFTGKPYVEGLGYAFLFRNYRADIGKWLTQDLIGYPDGWNNFAYCNNDILINIDPNGAWTISFGISFSAGAGGGVIGGLSIAFGYSVESGFTWGYTASAGLSGIIGGDCSASIDVSVTNAPNIGSLEGGSQMIGGSLGGLISVGGDVIITREGIYGISISMGASPLPNAEAHSSVVNTIVKEIKEKNITVTSIRE